MQLLDTRPRCQGNLTVYTFLHDVSTEMIGAVVHSFLSNLPYHYSCLFWSGLLLEHTPKLLTRVLLFTSPYLTCMAFAGISQQRAVLGQIEN